MKKMGLALMATMLTTTAFAETKTKDEAKTTTKENTLEKKEEIKKYERVVIDESMANREGKKYTINATLVGFDFGSPATGLEAGIHTKADTVFSLGVHDLKGLGNTDDNEDEYTFDGHGKGTAISLSMKKFTGNSFYIKPAIYHRRQTHIKSGISAYSTVNDRWTVISRDIANYTDLGVSFTIGNQWQWENFTLGCNWVGISKSLSTLELEGDLDQSDLDSANLLNFYMGATF